MPEFGAGAWGKRGQAQILGCVCMSWGGVWSGDPFRWSGSRRGQERWGWGHQADCWGIFSPSPLCHPGMYSSASPSPMAWSSWLWWIPHTRCRTKPSKSATGLGTLGPWGCPTWRWVMTTRAAEVRQSFLITQHLRTHRGQRPELGD